MFFFLRELKRKKACCSVHVVCRKKYWIETWIFVSYWIWIKTNEPVFFFLKKTNFLGELCCCCWVRKLPSLENKAKRRQATIYHNTSNFSSLTHVCFNSHIMFFREKRMWYIKGVMFSVWIMPLSCTTCFIQHNNTF